MRSLPVLLACLVLASVPALGQYVPRPALPHAPGAALPHPAPAPTLTPLPLAPSMPQLALPELHIDNPPLLPPEPSLVIVPPPEPLSPPDPLAQAAEEILQEMIQCLARGEPSIAHCLSGRESEERAQRIAVCLGSDSIPADVAEARGCVAAAVY